MNSSVKYPELREQDYFVYDEIFEWNVYHILPEDIFNQNILNIGGHYGMFDILCSTYSPKQIIAVEANPVNFVKLLNNTKNLRNFKAINAAVTTKTGDLLTISNEGGLSKINEGSITVSTVSLLDTVNLFPVNEDILLKMDIEGAEHEIILNTDPNLFRRFKKIYMELHEFSTPYTIKKTSEYITSLGFKNVWEGSYFTDDGMGNKTTSTGVSIIVFDRV